MNLQEHYNQLYKTSAEAISTGKYSIDSQITNQSDKRFGITLLIRPNAEIKANIQSLIDELKTTEPNQYYYPDSDIHITVLSIISCSEEFQLNQISPNDYVQLICKSMIQTNEIKIQFKGLTASPSAIMIQGFPTDETLDNLRNKLRENFKNSGLQQSIDSRYTISTAHATIMRFQEPIHDPEKLIAITDKFRNYDFGEFTVENLELVYNDWYQREQNTIHLADFTL
ncbi:2'-5' RNA ligase family protein [Flavobacterium branchiicola]|uniref:2'-5' RNA ligase family protein n=1 Tax=Flavobacterium branchiicola TaxID=1114875 RepID=A0ABV9PD91_9FLAO|nr:2'-5' RNA ligase family protein [Flavobacterium branchiicola]MBS7254703.1 mutarotase [Flavobacterium branchiicola]